jgi:hypothetical protein
MSGGDLALTSLEELKDVLVEFGVTTKCITI